MDVGESVRRRRSGALAKLADTAYKDFINGYFQENVDKMYETMELIRVNAPVQWMRLNIELMKLGMGRESNINININRQKDRDDLQALVRSRIPLPETGAYTKFEEITPQPLPVKKDESE